MIKLAKNEGFQIIPEGEHIFQIEKVDYDEDFGVVSLTMVTKDNMRHLEKYKLIGNDDEINEGALKAFSYLARVAMQDFSIENIEPADLEGKFVKCEVKHNKVPSTKKAGEFMTFVNLGKTYKADGFEEDGGEDVVGIEAMDETSLDDLLS